LKSWKKDFLSCVSATVFAARNWKPPWVWHKLENKNAYVKQRKENARLFIEGLRDIQDCIQLPYAPENCEHVYMLFPLVTLKEPKPDGALS